MLENENMVELVGKPDWLAHDGRTPADSPSSMVPPRAKFSDHQKGKLLAPHETSPFESLV